VCGGARGEPSRLSIALSLLGIDNLNKYFLTLEQGWGIKPYSNRALFKPLNVLKGKIF
jgi:hypothetical protein